ncbi:MAG: indolepyruvate oxidoreductase subunit beta [Thermodesulfobacteriota bacterium]
MRAQSDPLNMIICGVGGQGNILLSRMIGRIMIRKGYLVDIGETFGAAQRGGSVFSSLRVSKRKNHGPLIPEGKGHVILSLEPLEALRMLSMFGNPEVITVYNTQPVYPVGVLSRRFSYPDLDRLRGAVGDLSRRSWSLNATEMAMGLGSPIVANIIMLGALAACKAIPLTMDDVKDEMEGSFPPDKMELNLRALDLGFHAVG